MTSSTSPQICPEKKTSVSLSIIVPVYNEQYLVEASIRRVLQLKHEYISSVELIVVDDCSTDGSLLILQDLAKRNNCIRLFRHEKNRGKGAAVRTGIAQAQGDITLIHDADLEYHPEDIPDLLYPFISEGADAVYGSRYLSGLYRKALLFRHSLINRSLTLLSNVFTDLDLTDVETCYKAVRTNLLKSIPLRSDDFRIEIELTAKLAKRRVHLFEVPIRYMPRNYNEGKKIRIKDGVLALGAMFHYWLLDDMYQEDEWGSHILMELENTRKFNLWMGEQLCPYVGNRVLEIGAGIGTLTNQFIPRDLYVASDINPHYLHYLTSYALGKPYLQVAHIDACQPSDFAAYHGMFDTVLMVNVLEHVSDEKQTLRNVYNALSEGGKLILLVPQHPWLYGTLDQTLCHRERYTVSGLKEAINSVGFNLDQVFDLNRFSVPAWWINGKYLRRKTFSRIQLKIIDTLMPILRHTDGFLPWSGQSLIAIASKPMS